MDDKDVSNLKLERKECEKCGAIWLNGVHHWRTGAKGDELDLAGLVCNVANSELCINPKKGCEGGDTWARRRDFLSGIDDALKDLKKG